MATEVAEEYLSSLADLTVNSKPLINMLTMLAEENADHASAIVQAIESHIGKVSPEVKLPVLYLIDSIVKNVGPIYIPLFTHNIVQIFASVFEKADEKTRMNMFKLRQTWNEVFPPKKMYALDVRIQHLDQNWPMLAPAPSIHLNPKFLKHSGTGKAETPTAVVSPAVQVSTTNSTDLKADVLKKQQDFLRKQEILLELQQKKRELELIQQKILLGDQIPQAVVRPAVNEDAAKLISMRGGAPRAVVMPPASTPANSPNNTTGTKTKIAPANSILVAAAKSRDPRLARQTPKPEPAPEPKVETRDPRKKKKSPQKPEKVQRNEKKPSESEADLLEELLSQQKQNSAKLAHMASRTVEKKAPEVSVAEEQIQQRQMAMLKAPVLGQLNRKDSDTGKSRRRRSPPPSDGKSRKKSREKSRSSKPEKKRERQSKKDTINSSPPSFSSEPVKRSVSPRFSPPEDFESVKPPVPVSPNDFETIMSSPSPSPPPPPVISTVDMPMVNDKPEPVVFKNRKGAQKMRNYSRRNKERSPTPPIDVDLRLQAQNKPTESIVDVGKDVDLRLLAMSDHKKRLSTETGLEEPPNKRGKSDVETIQLFGNKDMDERLPPPGAQGLRTPPPPMISTTPPKGSPLAEEVTSHPQSTWADVKPHSDANSLSRQLELHMERADLARRDTRTSPGEGDKDRLGRPLLYNRLPNDPRERRESLNQHRDHVSDAAEDLHVDDILVQAKQQLNRGTMSLPQYNELMAQIVRMNESQKIRDLQRRRHASPTYEGPARSKPGWRNSRHEEDGAPYERRWRGSARGGGQRGRNYTNQRWRDRDNREARFAPGGLSPEWMDHDSRSQELMPAVELPSTDTRLLEQIAADPARQITVDGTPRTIRFYGSVGVVLMSFDCAREVSFENGMRRVFIAGLELTAQLNGPPVPFLFQKATHTVRLGPPTRELYIDDQFYEVYFGGAPVRASLAGIPCTVQLEGPPPQLRFAPHPNDFCLGCVMLIVDARSSFTIYLDAKPQRIEINGRPAVLKLLNRLTTVLINDVAVPLQFGGNPVPVIFADSQHYLRLTGLPPNVVAGRVSIRGMDDLNESPPSGPETADPIPDVNMEIVPATDLNRGMYMDLVSTMMAGPSEVDTKVAFNYQVEPDSVLPASSPTPSLPISNIPATSQPTPVIPAPVLNSVNINELFNSLLATGIISKQPAPEPTPELPSVKTVDLQDPQTLREPQPGLVGQLYSGIQCGSCGVRFPPEETRRYSQHLDWHFRQNRRDRDAARRGSSRRWYYDVSDWIQFEEIEDLEERAQSWFETEAQVQEEVPEEDVKSVPAPSGGVSVCCEVCNDRFDTFFHEDTEEWHLRHCISVDDKYYHPVCYQDSVKIPEEPLAVEKISAPPLLEPFKEEEPIQVEQSIVVLEDDDRDDGDDVEVVTADDEAVQTLVQALVERVVMEEECDASPIEDDELEVLAVTNKDENKPPIDIIDVPEGGDDEEYKPPSPAVYDPNKKIKQEPMDEMESPVAQVDQTISTVQSSIDGNVELTEAPAAPAPTTSKIKITFTKSLPVVPEPVSKAIDTPIDPLELQIEEVQPEPLPLKPKKPRIAARIMTEYPTVQKGTELSGLCSIM